MMLRSTIKPTYIDGRPFLLTLPTGGDRPRTPNAWDAILSLLEDNLDGLHTHRMFSWCLNTPDDPEDEQKHLCDHRVRRGYISPRYWNTCLADCRQANTGYRPILIPLRASKDKEGSFEQDLTFGAGLEIGQVLFLGTLLMDNKPVSNPKDPIRDGDIPDYVPSADLRIGNTVKQSDCQIKWIKAGSVLIADRVLLKNISWIDLQTQGLTPQTKFKQV